MTDILTRYDLEQFIWKPLEGEHVQKGYFRPLAGGERVHDILIRHLNEHTMFMGIIVDLHELVSVTKLASSAQECWCSLRFQFPIIASSIRGSDQEPILTYTTGTPQEISQWARRTLLVHSPSHIDLEQLRADEGQMKVPSFDGDFTWLHLVPGELANDGTVSKFGLLFNCHHALGDGNSMKIILNHYLDQLAKVLPYSRSTSEAIQWGNEFQNLPLAVFNVLNSHEALPIPPGSAQEPSFDNKYYKCLGSVLDGFDAVTKNAYGFRARPKDTEWPKTRHAEILFTREESERILIATKTSGLTLTHIAHAALAMVVIADNPPTSGSSSKYLGNQHFVNERSRLKSGYSLYPGYALSISSIRIPVSAFLSSDGNVLPLDQAMLLKVAEIAKVQYRAHKAFPSGLSHMAQLGEIWASTNVQSGHITLPTNQCYTFVSDGKGERYLNHTFTAETGETVLSVPKFFISLNIFNPGPAFRLSSWGGVIDIGADYNSNIVEKEDVLDHLNQLKMFMLLILD